MRQNKLDVERVHNFYAGPATLPVPALKRAHDEFFDFRDQKMSVLEISHRSDVWERTVRECQKRIRELMDLPDEYHVLFLQGGASTQFAMVPMNLASPGEGPVQIADTGRWSNKKIAELDIQSVEYEVTATSEDTDYDRIPEVDPADIRSDAAYFHLCSNETIGGIQWSTYPDTGELPLVADMSSDIMSRPIEVENFDLMYAGAQKNLGPAGVTLVILHERLLERTPDGVPTMLRYDTHVEKNSMHNTPPVFSIYMVNQVMRWLQELGGLEEIARRNRNQADEIYRLIDDSDFYRGAAHPDSRSMMNITFRLPSQELEEEFVTQAEQRGLVGLKGHRSVGGCRASLYNSQTNRAVETLADFMRGFEP